MSDGGAVIPIGGTVVAELSCDDDSGATVAIMLESLDETAVGAIVSVVEELPTVAATRRSLGAARFTFFGGSGSMPSTSSMEDGTRSPTPGKPLTLGAADSSSGISSRNFSLQEVQRGL